VEGTILKTALGDVKVVEYGNLIGAPYCSKLMADLGAEVIKVEKPGEGDVARSRQPFLNDIPGIEHSGLFLYLNANKLGVTLNLEKPAGREIFKRLIKDADILVENTECGELDELGLGYDDLKQLNPALVMTSMTVFGQTGPYRHFKGNDFIAGHMSGHSYIMPRFASSAELPPLMEKTQIAFLWAITAAVATMMALHWQRRTGVGQQVDASALEAAIQPGQFSVMFWPYARKIVTRETRNTVGLQQFVKCKDGQVFFHCSEQNHWQSLVKVMGNPEWAHDDRFKTSISRGDNREALEELVTRWTMDHTKAELFQMAAEYGFPMAPVNSVADVMANQQLKERDFFVEWEHPVAGKLTYPGAPARLSRTPWAIHRPAPLLGQHNEEIYCKRLGYSQEELTSMYQAGII